MQSRCVQPRQTDAPCFALGRLSSIADKHSFEAHLTAKGAQSFRDPPLTAPFSTTFWKGDASQTREQTNMQGPWRAMHRQPTVPAQSPCNLARPYLSRRHPNYWEQAPLCLPALDRSCAGMELPASKATNRQHVRCSASKPWPSFGEALPSSCTESALVVDAACAPTNFIC